MHLARALIFSLALLALAGCATWTPGGSPHTSKAGFTLTPPAGWMFHPNAGGQFFATRDGIVLQQFSVTRFKLPHTLPQTKRTLTADLTPYELSEAFADEKKSVPGVNAHTVTSRDAARIDGRDGFRFDGTHVTEEGLKLSMRTWGVVADGWLYVAVYSAPTRHYFARDLAVISETVDRITFASVSPSTR